MKHVSVRNFEHYQHYKNGKRPFWIKLYLALRIDPDFAELSQGARLLWFYVLLLAAERENRIPADPSWLAVEVGMSRRSLEQSLDELLDRKYLVPSRAYVSIPEKEKEKERTTKPPRTTTDVGGGS